jgi:hypothetical protein
MSKEIWLPDSKTHVIVEDGQVKIWDTMVMVKEELDKQSFGFEDREYYPSPSSPADKERYFK